MNNRLSHSFARLLAWAEAGLVVFCLASAAWAQTTAFTYQGKLTDNNLPANALYDFQFKLFDAPSGGVQVGATVASNAVVVSGGVFTVTLDFGANAFPGAARFLEISVRPAGVGAFTTLSPRQPVTSTPYAIQSLNAAVADGLSPACAGCVSSTQIGSLPADSGSYIQNTTTQQAASNFNISGNGTMDSLDVNSTVSLAGSVPPAKAPAGQGRLYYDAASDKVKVSENGGAYVDLIGASGVGGSGTVNSVPLWTGGTTLGAALITQSGTSINMPNSVIFGAGTSGHVAQFGSPNSETGLTFSGGGLRADLRYNGTLKLVNGIAGGPPGATSGIAINSSGNVGVGAETPVSKLDVRGNLVLDSGINPSVIFTAASGGEQNKYLGLINSPTTQSASGLKAGGILVADSFSYANPGKNDLVVKGQVTIGSNAALAAKLNVTSASTANAIYALGGNTTSTSAGDAVSATGGNSNSATGGTGAVLIGGTGATGGNGAFLIGGNGNNTGGRGLLAFGGSGASGGAGVAATGGAQGGAGVSATGGTHNSGEGGVGLSAIGGNSSGGLGGFGIVVRPGNGSTGQHSAGVFFGNVTVNGSLSKNSGSFRIDHPLDPANKYLFHSFVESPDMLNVYNGVVVLDNNGAAEITLPQYFSALNRDFRYQLTCIGGFAPVYIAEEVKDNHFRVAGGRAGLKVSWQVTGIRQDAYANAHRIQVEVEKPPTERGYYLNPELFGQPKEKGIEWALQPELMRQLQERNKHAQPEKPPEQRQ